MSGDDHRRRRRRSLSDDDHAVWDTVKKSVKPLRTRRAAHKAAREPDEDRASLAATPPAARPPSPVRAPIVPAIKPLPLTSLDRRERSRIARGRRDIEARLDLHGHTQERAHGLLLRFLQHAQADRLSLVLVITGKGRSGPQPGVLRRQVPEWLSLPAFRGLVIGFEEAAISHGGVGALYVRVRRARM